MASVYSRVNGEVKLACLYPGPTNKRICPTAYKQIYDLDPNFKRLLYKSSDWGYKYYPSANEYTLVVKHDYFRGVIFDPLLKKLGSFDFVEIRYDCAGNIVASGVKNDLWDQYKNIRQNDIPVLKSSYVDQ